MDVKSHAAFDAKQPTAPTANGLPVTSPSRPVGEFDFAKYHRPELVERIAELVSVPATITTILKWTAITVVAVWIGLPLLFAQRVHWSLLTVVMVYGSAAGILIGVMLGIAAKLAKSFDDLMRVVMSSVEIAEQVSLDAGSMRAGVTAVPTGKQTLVGVYDHIVMPAFEAGLTRNTLVVGRVVFWLHRWTLKRILERVIRAMGRDHRPVNAGAVMDNVEGAAERAAAWLRQAHSYLDGIGTGMRRIVGWPVLLFLTMFFVLLALPILAIWWLT